MLKSLRTTVLEKIMIDTLEDFEGTISIVLRMISILLRCYRRLLNIRRKQHRTNESLLDELKIKLGSFERLLETTWKRKMQWFSHSSRRQGTLANNIMNGMVEGLRERGRRRGDWDGDVNKYIGKTWIECTRMAMDREKSDGVPQRIPP